MTARRILICLHDFHRGGTERVAIGLAHEWTEMGREVTILCGSTKGGLRQGVDPRVRVLVLDPPIGRGFLSRFRLARAMARRLPELQPDLIFLPGNFHALLANGLRRATKAPIALKISNPPIPEKLPFAKSIFRNLSRGVTAFAAMNRGLERELWRLLPGRKTVTLHDPVYIRAMAPSPKRGNRILWIGRLEPQKDPLLALETIAALVPKVYHLSMLGEGSLRQEVEQRIQALRLQHQVTLHGHVDAVEPFLASSDILLITSRYEGGPAVAVEALALEVPVVSTECSFLLRELITKPQAGIIARSRNPKVLGVAIRETLAHPPAAGELKALAAPFEPRACAAGYLAWFDSLVHG